MDLADPWPWCYIHLPRRTIARSGCRCRLARFCRVLIRRVKVADVGFCTIPVFVFCTRAVCNNKYGRDIKSDNKRIHRSFDPLVADRTKTTKENQKERFRDERRGCVSFSAKMWFRGPKRRKASERENEQIEREIRTSLIPTSSSVCMCVPVREKESSVYYSSYFGSVEGEINSHCIVVHVGKGWWWVIFVTRIDSCCPLTKPTHSQHSLGKKNHSLSILT